MRRSLPICLLVACMALALAPPSAPARPGTEALDLINKARARHGVKPLRSSPSLARSSRRYARWMLRSGYYGHLARIRANRTFHRLGEVILKAPGRSRSDRKAVRAWLHSPAHRSLLLDRRFRQFGFGRVTGRMYRRRVTLVVGHFGTR